MSTTQTTSVCRLLKEFGKIYGITLGTTITCFVAGDRIFALYKFIKNKLS